MKNLQDVLNVIYENFMRFMRLVSRLDMLLLQFVYTFSSRGSWPCFDNWLFKSYRIRFDTTGRVNITSHIESHWGVRYGVCGSHVSRYLLWFYFSYIFQALLFCLNNIAITLIQIQRPLCEKVHHHCFQKHAFFLFIAGIPKDFSLTKTNRKFFPVASIYADSYRWWALYQDT